MHTILLAPLNWGLGHATRSLPLASALERAAREACVPISIHWASDGDASSLLLRERPDDAHHPLPGYGVRYPTRSPLLNMAWSGPRMLSAIGRETRAVRALHKRYDYDLIVSDNRYGCRVPGVRSLLMTHQLHLPIEGLAGRLAQGLQEMWLGGFDQLLVPDRPAPPRLADAMSAPLSRLPCRYLGPVSRFGTETSGNGLVEQEASMSYATVCLLSGPEPTRTQLEVALYGALQEPARTLLIRGTEAPRPEVSVPEGLAIHDMMTGATLRSVLAKAHCIITRPGYTTVMDLAALGRRAVFVPTPGQPEQERLGESMALGGYGVTVAQEEVGVEGVLAKAVGEVMGMERETGIGGRTNGSLGFARDDGGGDDGGGGDALISWARDEVARLD